MLSNAKVPNLGLVAFSGTGKTSLLLKLLPEFKRQGVRVGMIKHAHHTFEIDQPGKDSYELRHAGARKTLVASRQLWALISQPDWQDEPQLDELLAELNQGDLDLILVEGFKHETFPKIELHRPSLGHPLLFVQDPMIIAVATDGHIEADIELPVLDLNNIREIVAFIRRDLGRLW